MRKIRNFFICSFHLNCPTTEEQITDRQVLLGVTQKVSSNSKHTCHCQLKPTTATTTRNSKQMLYFAIFCLFRRFMLKSNAL